MLSSLELNRCLICNAFYGKEIVKRNYLKREDFPHCTVRSLTLWLTMLQNVTSSVSLGSPVWLFHCGIKGRTELISCTDCWASHLSIEIHIFCKDWDLWGYFFKWKFAIHLHFIRRIQRYLERGSSADGWMQLCSQTLSWKWSRKGFGLRCCFCVLSQSDCIFQRK